MGKMLKRCELDLVCLKETMLPSGMLTSKVFGRAFRENSLLLLELGAHDKAERVMAAFS